MCTYGFTDFSNGSSAFGSNSSHPTPLQSTTSGFSNNAGPSIEPAVGTITPASSFPAIPSLGSGGTAVASWNAGSSLCFGSPALFGTTTEQRPTFGDPFGYTTPSQPSLFGGSTSQQTQPALGINALGSSSVFGAPNQPSSRIMDSFSAPAAFGAATTSPFGSQPTSTFGSRGGFGPSAFGLTVGTPPTFSGQPSSFGTSSAFGQTNSGFGSSPFNSTPFSFGPQTSPFGTPTTTPSPFKLPAAAFGQPANGSKVVAYAPTAETECTNFSGGKQTFENKKYESISAMPVYKGKSHEELRWEDYQLGCKGNSAFGSATFATSNQAVSPGGFQSSAFRSPAHPVRISEPPSFGTQPARPVFQLATPSGPCWGSNVWSHTTTPNPFSSGYNKHTNEPKVETVKSEATQLASTSTHCPEPERREGKQIDVSSSTHFREPQDNEDVKKIDKKKMQDLRMAVEVEREVERRVSAKHIAFLTSMLEKLDSLCI